MATKLYTVVPGDYLVKIAKEHGTTVMAIWEHDLNWRHRQKRGSPDVLYAGDVLHIPIPDPVVVDPPPAVAPPPPESPFEPLDLDKLGPPPFVPVAFRRGVSRSKAKTQVVVKPKDRFTVTDIRLVGPQIVHAIKQGFLLALPDLAAIKIVPAPPHITARYKAHFLHEYRKAGTSLPARPKVSLLALDFSYGTRANEDTYDPFRLNMLFDIAREGRLDLVQSTSVLVNERGTVTPKGRAALKANGITLLTLARLEAQVRISAARHGSTVRPPATTAAPLPAHPSVTANPDPVSGGFPIDNTREVVWVHLQEGIHSLAHEVFGHLYLARRKQYGLHIRPLTEAAFRQPNATIDPDPLGGKFEGFGARGIDMADTHLSRTGPLGFLELFAELEKATNMVPTRGVSPLNSAKRWTDQYLSLLEALARASHAHALGIDPQSGTATLLKNHSVDAILPGRRVSSPTPTVDLLEMLSVFNNEYTCLMRRRLNRTHFGDHSGAAADAKLAMRLRANLRSSLESMRPADATNLQTLARALSIGASS